MIATGPPQSAICVVSNSRSAVTSDRSGRSAASWIVHCSGWDLLTCVSSGLCGAGRDAPLAPAVQPSAHLVQPAAQRGDDRLLRGVGAVLDVGPRGAARLGQ